MSESATPMFWFARVPSWNVRLVWRLNVGQCTMSPPSYIVVSLSGKYQNAAEPPSGTMASLVFCSRLPPAS